jgi:adenosylcobinamide-phosphate synthase
MILSSASAGFGLDLLAGDPHWRWHPVRLMGRAVAYADARLPRTKAAGLALALGLPLAVGLADWLIARKLGRLAWGFQALMIYFCVASTDMLRHARDVVGALEAGDLALARVRVSSIVGRDTAELDETGVLRATVESVAESFCDGVVAPLFFAFLGGAPWALAHKAVSTLDSMVGYKNARYAEFGWASARLDDAMNWIPARLSALLVALCGGRPAAALRCALRDAPRQPSPNSGWPEAAFAGALGVQLGGPSSYQGRVSPKALIGDAERPLSLEAARESLGLFFRASLGAALIGEILWHCLKA